MSSQIITTEEALKVTDYFCAVERAEAKQFHHIFLIIIFIFQIFFTFSAFRKESTQITENLKIVAKFYQPSFFCFLVANFFAFFSSTPSEFYD